MVESASTAPRIRTLVLFPALITLVVTLVRLALELIGAPAFLANGGPGGVGALIGIAWLPLIFGPYFAHKLKPHFAQGKPHVKRLAATLFVYGLLARIPVVLITIPAFVYQWGTHYEKFPFEATFGSMLAATLGAQLLFWAGVWTVGTGLFVAWLTGAFRRERSAAVAS